MRLQLLRKAAATGAVDGAPAAPTPGMLSVMGRVARTEGVLALYRGFWPAMHRQLLFASLRVGLYGQISALFAPPGGGAPSLTAKIAAGLAAGAIGITIATPTDLVKVRLQSEPPRAAGVPPRYSGVFNAYATIAATEGGVRGLWRGLGPNVIRNSVINASELVSYDVAKGALVGWGMPEGVQLHLASALFASGVATLLGNPVDVVKTRVMASQAAGAGGAAASSATAVVYSGALDCVVKTLRAEGPAAFYQGVVPQFFRITGWNVTFFLTMEQVRRVIRDRQAVAAQGEEGRVVAGGARV